MADPEGASVVIWDIFAHLSHPHEGGRYFVRRKKGQVVPDDNLHIWTGSNKAYDNIFSGVLAPKGRIILMPESVDCDNAPAPAAASLAMQRWCVSLFQSSRLLFEKVQWPYKEMFQLGEISPALCYFCTRQLSLWVSFSSPHSEA